MGIEPTLSAWEAEVLPLNYTRGAAGTAGEARILCIGPAGGNSFPPSKPAMIISGRPGFLVYYYPDGGPAPFRGTGAAGKHN